MYWWNFTVKYTDEKPISWQENKTVQRLTYILNEHYFFFDFTLNLKNLQEILNFFNVTLIINSRKPIEKIKYVTALISSIIDEMFIDSSVSGGHKYVHIDIIIYKVEIVNKIPIKISF